MPHPIRPDIDLSHPSFTTVPYAASQRLSQRLAALVPRPRLQRMRFHGVLAPNAKLLALVVPQEPEPPAQAAPHTECEELCAPAIELGQAG